MPSLVIASDSVKIGNLTVTVTENNVQVYKDSRLCINIPHHTSNKVSVLTATP